MSTYLLIMKKTPGILRPPDKTNTLYTTRRFTTRGTLCVGLEPNLAGMKILSPDQLDEQSMCRIFVWLRQASLHLLNFMTRPDTIRHLGSHSRESNPLRAADRHRSRAILCVCLCLWPCYSVLQHNMIAFQVHATCAGLGSPRCLIPIPPLAGLHSRSDCRGGTCTQLFQATNLTFYCLLLLCYFFSVLPGDAAHRCLMTYPATRADLMRKVGGSICTYQIQRKNQDLNLSSLSADYGLAIRCITTLPFFLERDLRDSNP